MKATIAGVTYEGTPDEIAAIVDRMTPKEGSPYSPYKNYNDNGWWKINSPPELLGKTIAVTKIGCSNKQCYCTGACTR